MVSEGTSIPCASMITGTRRMMPSVSGLIENSPRPAAACSIGSTLRSSPGKVTRYGVGSGPRMAKPVCKICSALVAARHAPSRLRRRRSRECLIASARTASLLGRLSSFSRVSASMPRKLCSAIAGDMRSGSAKMMSRPTATAPSSGSLVTRSATTVRGHGHCPISFRLSSSISTMTTGRDRLHARAQRLKQIEGAQMQFFERSRIGQPQRHQRE